MTGEENLRLLQQIDENRSFLLLFYQHNPVMLQRAEQRIRQLFEPNAANSASPPPTLSDRACPKVAG